MIVIDTDSVKPQSVMEANPKVVERLYKRYNSERIVKETMASTVRVVSKYANTKVSECKSYVDHKMGDYLRQVKTKWNT